MDESPIVSRLSSIVKEKEERNERVKSLKMVFVFDAGDSRFRIFHFGALAAHA